MDGIVVFQQANSHPLSWMLHKSHRHVWCATRRGDIWVSYDWRCGLPDIRAEAGGSFDLGDHYTKEGYTVIPMPLPERPLMGPLILNNCVGHTKLMMGIRAPWVLTPRQLLRHLVRKGHTPL